MRTQEKEGPQVWARKAPERLQTWCGGRLNGEAGTQPHPPAWGGISL